MTIGYIDTTDAGSIVCEKMTLDNKGHLHKCRGEFCAAWRYALHPQDVCEPQADISRGYCGTAGKPEHD